MQEKIELLNYVYKRFNARDMEAVLAALHEDVMWANGMEGGHVQGRDAVRAYWTRQWAMVDPHVEPVSFSKGLKAKSSSKSIRSCTISRGSVFWITWWVISSQSKTELSAASISAMPECRADQAQ